MTNKTKPTRVALSLRRPRLFGSAYTRQVVEQEGLSTDLVTNKLEDSNISSTSSFRYDPPGQGIRSTQQIALDYSKFENHTFFNSAEVNVNVAFERIINNYPFDGTKKEVEEFFDSLSGFEKYVYDQFPKNKGYLFFSGSSDPDGGTYIVTKDFAGTEYPLISKNKTGRSILDPGVRSVSAEMQLFVPDEANDNSIIFQKISNKDQGFTLALSESSTSNCELYFMATSGSKYLSASLTIQKGAFNHVGLVLDRRPGKHIIEFYSGSELKSVSSTAQELGAFGFITQSLTIGSGTSQFVEQGGKEFIPQTTFSGAIDEFRLYHGNRTSEQFGSSFNRSIFSSENLVLYYKFNEPTGSLGGLSSIVLDSSGNSLHSKITNFDHSLRNTGSIAVPLTAEKLSLTPVLFPAYSGVVSLNSRLLSSASLYDKVNPNLITNLIPQHYLQEGQVSEGFDDEEGTIGDQYAGDSIPGSGELGSPQLISSLLYVWAKFFDEQKIALDHMSNLLHTGYTAEDSVTDQFLPQLFKYYGFDTPNFFSNSSVEQFVDGDNLGIDIGTSEVSLQSVQNQLWRRILTNMQEIIKSKGTIHAVESLIRSVGIDPKSNLRIREFGGPSRKTLGSLRETKEKVSAMLDMSGTMANVSVTLSPQGIPDNKPFIQTNYLSASRREKGAPIPQGSFEKSIEFPPHGISNNEDDGLLTSGSFTIEGLFKFKKSISGSHPVSQSLFRLMSTGSISDPAAHRLLFNVVAISGSEPTGNSTGSLKLFARPSSDTSDGFLELPLTGVNIFDGELWNISAGRIEPREAGTHPSASYFIRAGRQNFGTISEFYITSSLFHEYENGSASTLIFANKSDDHNSSGSFLVVGSQSLGLRASGYYLNSVSSVNNEEARLTTFSGKAANLRFWSGFISTSSWKEHIRNFNSVGVENPKENFNFANGPSGSFKKLRVDLSADQIVTRSNATGELEIVDFSQNGIFASGSGFEFSKEVIKPESIYYSHLSPKFDEAASNNKVRVRSFNSRDNVEIFDAEFAPVYEVRPSERPTDDARFSIDFSVTDALDEDIVNIFGTLQEIDNALGGAVVKYADDYPDLAKIRSVYFNRLTSRVNLKSMFEFFKWFDSSIGMFIEQLLPRKTSFLGTNFVVESHMLERPKIRYLNSYIYLDETLRRRFESELVQDFTTDLSR